MKIACCYYHAGHRKVLIGYKFRWNDNSRWHYFLFDKVKLKGKR